MRQDLYETMQKYFENTPLAYIYILLKNSEFISDLYKVYIVLSYIFSHDRIQIEYLE